MAMQDGIGRTGYRVIADVFMAVGLLGLGMIWYGVQFDVGAVLAIGIVFAAACIIALYIVSWRATIGDKPPRDAKPSRQSNAQTPPPAAAPARGDDLGFDYDAGASSPYPPTGPAGMDDPFADAPRPTQDIPAERWDAPSSGYDPARPPSQAHVAAAYAPPVQSSQSRTPPGPQASASVEFQVKDRTAWPGAQKNTWRGTGIDEESDRAHPRRYPRQQFTEKYTRTTPLVRSIIDNGPPEPKPAPQPGAGQFQAAPPPDKTRGACGRCGTILLAPKERPIKIRCPVCSKTTLLDR